ncbi:MAG TPA: AAA family ATPase [Patescibacteria group bacterium]|nr:AAA family ATPase [Patescibacteria group bacterium]
MLLSSLSLQQFRNYSQSEFTFVPGITVIVGPNTAGKTNLLDSIHLLSTGKSFLTDREEELIRFNEEFGRIKGTIVEGSNENRTIDNRKLKIGKEDGNLKIEKPASTIHLQPQFSTLHHQSSNESIDLEVLITTESQMHRAGKRYFVNGVPRRRIDFASYLPTLFFTPLDLEIVSGSPSHRRHFLDDVLEQVDKEYQRSLTTYNKGLRQRNALLERVQETGVRNDKLFNYWDELLIKEGTYIHDKRQEFLNFINEQKKQIFNCQMEYDHSIISPQRLEKYKNAEIGSGVTLVGPHRDDFLIQMDGGKIDNRKWKIGEEDGSLKIDNPSSIVNPQRQPSTSHNPSPRSLKAFASRGQQRLAVLQLKMLQLQYMQENIKSTPLLLLDDIFSELDEEHIELVSEMIGQQQTIITTTHQEFVKGKFQKQAKVIELDLSS